MYAFPFTSKLAMQHTLDIHIFACILLEINYLLTSLKCIFFIYEDQSIRSCKTIDGACLFMGSLGIVLRNPTPYAFMFRLEVLPTGAS